jgi:hypothetical protein
MNNQLIINKLTSAKQGQIGEKLFEEYLNLKKIKYLKLHKNGADFEVENIGRVDLKTRNCLRKNSGDKVTKFRHKLPDVKYIYLSFWSDKITFTLDSEGILSYFDELSWDDFSSIYSDFDIPLLNELSKSEINNFKNQIKEWVLNNWKLRVKVISRSGRKAQDNFEKNGWGANNFYTKPSARSKYDLVVLLYFDQKLIYKIHSYPINIIDNIQWYAKDKGPNLEGIMIFDPKVLNKSMVFESLDQFKSEFKFRFK